ncbi:MAG TPA: glycosyltransferase family 4 protein [Xanthobacteraceae bacterium]|nr:glycosyltransferase family 4 protein [Xanthobacteraceae bacterium]
MKLRILHTEASTGWGGQEIRILDESAGMQARGHTLRIAAPAEAPIVDAARKRGLGADAIPINRRTLAGLRGLIAVIDAFKPDVIVTHSSTDSWLAALATWLFRRRVTVVRTRHLSTPIAAGILNRWLYGWVPRRVVTTGEAVRTMLIERLALNPAHVVSVPTGTDLARFFPGDRAEARRALGLSDGSLVGIVATLRSWKGHRFLLRALADPRLADLRLVIVGDGPQEKALRQQVDELGLQARVQFAGQQSDVAPWMRAFDVMALPSTGNEGVPQALMQAMACGIPVVTTPVGAIPELVRDGVTGLLVPAENRLALAEAIARLLGDKALASRLAAAGRELIVAKHSSTAMLDAMEDVLRQAVSGEAVGART